MLQSVAVCGSVLQIHDTVSWCMALPSVDDAVLQCVAECCSGLQCDVVCYILMQRDAECCRLLQSVAECYRVLQSVAECCSVLQVHCKLVCGVTDCGRHCDAVCCSVLQIAAV